MPSIEKHVHRHKILIVDDEAINIKMMLNALKNNYQTLVATNGLKALSLIRSDNSPDLILLDISMPEMDGYDVCRELKKNKEFDNIPVIFVSANASEAEQTKGLELGAVDYLTKPVCLPILRAKIKSHLEMKQHRDFMEILIDEKYQEIKKSTSLHEKDKLKQQENIQRYIREVQENQERLKLSLWGSGDEFWNWNLLTGVYIRENPLSLNLESTIHLKNIDAFRTYIHPEDFSALYTCFHAHINNEADFFEASYRAKDTHDEWVWLLQRGKVVERNAQGTPVRISGTLRNISHLKVAEQELLLAAKSFESISDAVWVCDEHWNILKINTAFTEITGYIAADAVGTSLLKLMGNEYNTNLQELSLELEDSASCRGHWHREIWGVKQDGTHFPQDLNISVLKDKQHNITHFIGAFSDITYRKNTEDKLRYLANYDSLTGLPNRTLFMERIKHAIEISQRKQYKMAVVFLDLDNFKNINDTLGHSAGDSLLKVIANCLNKSIRDSDTAARLGGDEFILLLEHIHGVSDILPVVNRVLKEIAQPLDLLGTKVSVSASIGVAIYPDSGHNDKDLLRHADIAMYHAKSQGRNNVQFYKKGMDQRSVFHLELEQQLHRIVNEDQLVLHYQPKIKLSNGELHGLEVLARWQHPTHGLIPPDLFISMAEESGHIIELGEAILKKACTEAKVWWDNNLILGRLAINLSAVQIAQANLPERIEAILKETSFQADRLELEITESSMMQNKDLAVLHMLKFKKMGIELSIDDFGTGYSSLSSIKNLPVNTLKIDRSFIQDIDNSIKDKGIVASIIDLAHHLNLKVIAEGVETPEQQEMLSELNCEEMQGYLFSKPLAKDGINRLLQEKASD
jgi:diguanylate cyclase (GGDEF)-like protein/PAS domain S-box-containing protein